MLYNTISFKGKTINFRVKGKGDKVLVLLHGFMNSLQVWDKFFEACKEEIKLVAIDLIGHGESETIEQVSSMELQAQMVKEVADYLQIKQFVLAGHSMGGMIALCFAHNYPQYLKGLCLLHSQALADNPKGKQNRIRACKLIDDDRLKYIVDFIPNLFAPKNIEKCSQEIQRLKEIAINTPKEGIIAAQMGMIERSDRRDVLQQCKVPMFFVIGKQDIRADLVDVMAQASLPDFSEILLLDCGHMSFVEEPETINHSLLAFSKMCFAL